MRAWAVVLVFLVWHTCSCATRKVTILHTTDIHGWVAGHPHNTTLDADFGDFRSLLLHMKANAANNGEEFLLFDSGDLIEGTGLSDATAIHGQYIFEILKNVSQYDALTIGNHDIGHPEVIALMEQSFIPFWKGSYLTANSFLLANNQFIGSPFTFFTTDFGTNVLVLGYLFNFTHNANNTIVVPVSVSLTQPYFQKAMQIPNVDLIVVAAHIAPQLPPELDQIYAAIRSYHKTTPLAILAGHSHVTDFVQLDPNAFIIESGKYFEVVGLIQFELDSNGAMQNLETGWVDTSVSNFVSLSQKTAATFQTPEGLQTKALIAYYEELLGLNIVYGCSPATYYPDGSFWAENSLYRLYVEQMVPKTVFNGSSGNEFLLTNTASLRYTLFEGQVTRNDIYTISPFNDTFVYFQSIPGAVLSQIIDAVANVSGLISDRFGCLPLVRAGEDPQPNWYFSTFTIDKTAIYDLVAASYDAQTILPVLQSQFPKYANYVPYPTEYNGTGAIQDYVEQYFKC